MFIKNYAASRYNELVPAWDRVHDCYEGAIEIQKDGKQEVYLPSLESERDKNGQLKPQWKTRFNLACFKNLFRPTVDDIVGIMQRNPANIRFNVADKNETPQEVKDIEIYGNADNDGLLGLKRRLNHEQVLFGRAALLLDVEVEQVEHGVGGINPRFVIREYPANTILDGEIDTPSPDEPARLKWALLNKSTSVYDPREKRWVAWRKYRVLGMTGGAYYIRRAINRAVVQEVSAKRHRADHAGDSTWIRRRPHA